MRKNQKCEWCGEYINIEYDSYGDEKSTAVVEFLRKKDMWDEKSFCSQKCLYEYESKTGSEICNSYGITDQMKREAEEEDIRFEKERLEFENSIGKLSITDELDEGIKETLAVISGEDYISVSFIEKKMRYYNSKATRIFNQLILLNVIDMDGKVFLSSTKYKKILIEIDNFIESKRIYNKIEEEKLRIEQVQHFEIDAKERTVKYRLNEIIADPDDYLAWYLDNMLHLKVIYPSMLQSLSYFIPLSNERATKIVLQIESLGLCTLMAENLNKYLNENGMLSMGYPEAEEMGYLTNCNEETDLAKYLQQKRITL